MHKVVSPSAILLGLSTFDYKENIQSKKFDVTYGRVEINVILELLCHI